MITMQEIEPLGLCLATQQLMDKRFRSNFGDTLILRDRDLNLEPNLLKIKRELNSSFTERKYLEGLKLAIVSNIDKILSLVGRYVRTDITSTENIVIGGKEMIKKVLSVENFDQLGALEAEFKTRVTLPVYGLFMKYNK